MRSMNPGMAWEALPIAARLTICMCKPALASALPCTASQRAEGSGTSPQPEVTEERRTSCSVGHDPQDFVASLS
jgi:hypothetical protein